MNSWRLDEALIETPQYRETYTHLVAAGEQEPPPPTDWGEVDDESHSAETIKSIEPSSDRKEPSSPWARTIDAPSFLAQIEQDFQGLAKHLLVRCAVSLLAAPRGLGKTLFAHALAVVLATGGSFRGEEVQAVRVLLVDRDNPKSVIKKRLRGWGAHHATNLHILTREDAPDLRDKKAWRNFPVDQYDVLVIDSVGSSTEGVSEKEGKETTQILATILDLVHRDDGPAVLLLTNTTKDGASLRGRGEWADRVDILYEIRDATGFVPSGSKPWWIELPPAGETAWAERAARRKGRTDYRLAFIPSKFRFDVEPEPFCVEMNLPTEGPWTLRDVTADLGKQGADVIERSRQEQAAKIEIAARALAEQVTTHAQQGAPLLKTEAEKFLREVQRLKLREARALLEAKNGELWREDKLPGGRGKGTPKALLPVNASDLPPSGDGVKLPLDEVGKSTPNEI